MFPLLTLDKAERGKLQGFEIETLTRVQSAGCLRAVAHTTHIENWRAPGVCVMINDGRREILIARSPAPRCLGGGGCERRSGAGARSLGPGRPIARSTTPSAAEKPRI